MSPASRSPIPTWLRRGLAATLGLVALLGSAAAWLALTSPPIRAVPLPGALVALDSEAGQRLLRGSDRADHDVLRSAFQAQARRSWCGVASSAIVLTALGLPTDQQGVFTPRARSVRSPWSTSLTGMTLDQLAGLLGAHGVEVRAQHAGDSSLEAFRAEARANLAAPGDHLVINYHRAPLGQLGSGHISPLSAYHADSDRFLVLDVAAHRYPPAWVEASQLWEAMATTDSASGRTRGWVSVGR